MALTVATTHTWQTEVAAAPENDSSIMDRPTGDNPDATNQPVNMNSASSVGHGQPTGNQLYTANPFPPPGSQWTPSPNAAPFYPQFPPFYNAGTPPVATQAPFFDPNQQLAWYQQMMLQQAMAQQLHQNQFNHAMAGLGRVRTNSGPQQNDFFQAQGLAHPPTLIPGFPFQSGTPPASSHSNYNGASQPSHQSFRRGPQSHHMPGPRSNTFDNQDWSRLNAQNIAAPYARPDAAGSSHSVSSSNGSIHASAGGGGARQRTTSNNTNSSQTPPSSLRGQSSGPTRSSTMPQLTTDFERPRQPPNGRNNSSGPPSPASHSRTPHQRNTSNTSDRTIASVRGQPPSSSPTASSNNAASTSSAAPSSTNSSPNLSPVSRTNQRAPVKRSPLSQQQTFTEPSATSKRAKRLSKDDSELLPPTTVASALSARQSGLKGRFKRALAFNHPSSVDEHTYVTSSIGHGDASTDQAHESGEERDGVSPITPVAGESVRSAKPKSRAAALFSGKFNASTDNISLSSTVSSASVMIRKLGSIGKLARRNSLMGISSIFKDKNKDKAEGTSASGKRGKKSEKAEASVSHVTAELDRGGGSEDESWQNLTPAARVARQHTIKSNEEAAKRLREQAAASSASSAAAAMTNGVPAWERNTGNRRGEGSSRNISEDGTLLDDRSDDSGDGGFYPLFDRDATIRIPAEAEVEEEDEPWAVGLRRSIEKTRQPGKAVIKNHVGYIQEQHLDPPNQPFAQRTRSNSYQTVSESMPGPLAHLPSPDPDHIDGLQRSNSTSNTPEKPSFSLPAFNFEFGEDIDILPKADGDGLTYDVLSSSPGALANSADKGPTFAYTHPTANSSAPALSTTFDSKGGPATAASTSSLSAMKKSITFAATLSIYDTFSSSAYDRRSEPSTANRLTPALAQRIKEELNSFKMEEMEVHSASRIHTHFFV